MSNEQQLAREYARFAHDDVGQRRKGTNAPYWTHPQGVADLLEGYGASDAICITAELHDTAEDTEVTIDDLRNTFGDEVSELVSEVTNSPDLDGLEKETYMNRKLIGLTNDALTVKLGDCVYNLLDRPREQQAKRMYNNIRYLIKNREQPLQKIHKALINTFISAYKAKFQ